QLLTRALALAHVGYGAILVLCNLRWWGLVIAMAAHASHNAAVLFNGYVRASSSPFGNIPYFPDLRGPELLAAAFAGIALAASIYLPYRWLNGTFYIRMPYEPPMKDHRSIMYR